MAMWNIFSNHKKFEKLPRPNFLEFETFTWFLGFKIHRSIFLNYSVTIGSVFFFSKSEYNFFYSSKFWKDKSYFFQKITFWKLKKILISSLLHLEEESKSFLNVFSNLFYLFCEAYKTAVMNLLRIRHKKP